ncbi:hypothetical protein PMAYCL1PPCAC_08776, partial [Pristionchus mayeri]
KRLRHWSHLAIRQIFVEDDGPKTGQQEGGRTIRRPRRTRQTPIKAMVEFKLRTGGWCTAHAGVASACRVVKRRTVPFAAAGAFRRMMRTVPCDELYWRTSMDEAPVLLRTIARTTTVDEACVHLDFNQPTALAEDIRQFECRSLSFEQTKKLATLPLTYFSSGLFFPGVEQLLLKEIRFEEEHMEAFYQWLKSSTLDCLIWRFGAYKVMRKEFNAFERLVMGLRKHPGNRITACKNNIEVLVLSPFNRGLMPNGVWMKDREIHGEDGEDEE